MGDLTKNLSRSEFVCECGCGYDTVDFHLINILQECADYFEETLGFKIALVISGGNRCRRHNTTQRDLYKETNGLKGSLTSLESQHIYARAADFKLFFREKEGVRIQIDPEKVAQWIEKNYPDCSIGRYHNRTHLDTRTNGPARWDVRK